VGSFRLDVKDLAGGKKRGKRTGIQTGRLEKNLSGQRKGLSAPRGKEMF